MSAISDKYDMLAVVGPTACGKTALAVELALALDGEIISADSRQVYRGMDIGTGKDIAEYSRGEVSVPYHLINIMDAGEKYNLFEFQRDFLVAYDTVKGKGILDFKQGIVNTEFLDATDDQIKNLIKDLLRKN